MIVRPRDKRACIVTLTRDCFEAVVRLGAAPDPESLAGDELHELFRSLVDSMRARARALGIDGEELEDITYAVVALMDEIAIGRGGPVRAAWMRAPLQAHYFHETTAGDTFFRRLDAIAAARDEAPSSTLFVYYLSLLFGFRGRYRMRGREAEYTRLQSELHELLFPPGDDLPALAPDGARLDDGAERGARRLPWVLLGGVVFALGVALHIGLWLGARSGCGSLRDAAIGAANELAVGDDATSDRAEGDESS